MYIAEKLVNISQQAKEDYVYNNTKMFQKERTTGNFYLDMSVFNSDQNRLKIKSGYANDHSNIEEISFPVLSLNFAVNKAKATKRVRAVNVAYHIFLTFGVYPLHVELYDIRKNDLICRLSPESIEHLDCEFVTGESYLVTMPNNEEVARYDYPFYGFEEIIKKADEKDFRLFKF